MSYEEYPGHRRFFDAVSVGLRVFPLGARSKQPIGKWKKYCESAASETEVAAWEGAGYNVGIICGEPSGIVVIDVDSPEAQKFIDGLSLPQTPIVRTGNGRHYYFRKPPVAISNRVGVGGLKLDVRADGGYVVGAGSLHPNGSRYDWEISPKDVPFAPVPEALLDIIRKNRTRLTAASTTSTAPVDGEVSRFHAHLTRAKEDAVAVLARAEESTRNDTLFRVAVALANDVAGAEVPWDPFADALRVTALQIGLEENAVNATLDSSWRSGSARPTAWIVTAREWLYLSHPDVFYHLTSGNHLKLAAFNNTFAGAFSGKGTLSRFLLTQNLVEIAYDLTYKPDCSDRFIAQDDLVWYNTYRASDVASELGDAGPFKDFVSFLVPSKVEREHLLRMIAWSVRNPGRKLRHALLLRSQAQGVGKSMLIDIWSKLLGEHNVRKTTTEEISGNFQGYIKETLLVVLEELNWGFGPTGYTRLKDLITSDVAVVNEKFLPTRHWPNLASLVVLTNVKNPMILEDHDRRFFYIDSPATPRTSEYYSEFASWWEGHLGIIRGYLDEIDLSSFNPYAPPPMTDAKRELIASGRDDLTIELGVLIGERTGVFDRDIVTFTEIETELGNVMRGRTRSDLRGALHAFGAVSLGQQRVAGAWLNDSFAKAGGRASLWAIRNVRFWEEASNQDRAEEYGRVQGLWAQFDSEVFEVRHAREWPGGEAAFRTNFADGSA